MPELLGYQFDRTYAGAIERYRQVSTIAARDAIPTGKRWEGMLCYVTGENKDYQLRGGLTNSDWEEVAVGGGNLFDISVNDSDDITEGIVNLFMDSTEQAKLGYITITQAVDLDQLESDVAALGSGITFKGTWSPSGGSFPGGGSASIGDLYISDDSGTIDSVSFASGDGIIATTNSASTSTYSGNWAKTESVSDVTSVVGLTGAISKSALLAALNVQDGATDDLTGSEIRALLTGTLGSAEWETQLTTENVMDIIGGGLGGTQTRITVSYDDPNGRLDFVVEAPILVYADLATAIAAQGSQSDTQIIEFTDGSAFTGVTSGRVWARYLGTTNADETDYRIISKEEAVSQTAPIPLKYADDTALFAGQGNQITNYIYEVTDGSGFTGVSSGAIWVKYLGTTVGDETDYIIISKAVNSGGGDLLAANNLSDVASAATAFGNIKQAATTSATGVVELATTAEVNTGTDTTRAITPDALANSDLQTKVDGIEANADVTDATNVDAAGATMNTDTDVSSNSWVLDEDNMASDSATKVPTQQSVKAYVDNKTESISVFGSDLDTALEVGEKELLFCLFDFTLVTYWIGALTEVPTGAALTVDLKKNGVSITSTPASIDAGEATSLTGTAPVLTTTSFSKGDIISRNITNIGATAAGKGLQIVLEIIKT